MESNLIHIDLFGNNNRQIKRNRVLQLMSISLFTLSVILSFKLLVHMLFPDISPQYYEMTIIISSCLAVNLAASLILYKYQSLMELLESRLEMKSDNLYSTIRNLKMERDERRRYALDLRRSEEKYRCLKDLVSEGIVLLDVEGNFLEANRKMEELLGFPEAELLSMNVKQILPQEELERTQTALEEVVQTGAASLANGWVLRQDDKKVRVDFAGSKIDQADKTIIQGIFRVIPDAGERQRQLIRNEGHLG